MSADEKQYMVSFDDQTVSCQRPDGTTENVKWSEIEQVTVEATHAGPETPEFIWILWGLERQSGLVFPGGATGAQILFNALQSRLESFNANAAIEAKSAEENRTYIAWQIQKEGRVDPDM